MSIEEKAIEYDKIKAELDRVGFPAERKGQPLSLYARFRLLMNTSGFNEAITRVSNMISYEDTVERQIRDEGNKQ